MGHGPGLEDGSMGLGIGDRAGERQGQAVWEEHIRWDTGTGAGTGTASGFWLWL